ncbi:hypothetical protein [Paraglaciecola sp. 20A4]|uniref:hypothetical protein n=1 Tax=Paraglaciecola sp. 20A4 TaxID=2687288 RepID=UPI00140B0235|nr:hypothetical protein [Paraglaciecola sp. 20A4]
MLILFLTNLLLSMSVTSMASETNHEIGGLPLTYQLSEVSISLTRHATARAGSTINRVSILGSGNATLEHGGKAIPFAYPSEEKVKLLNALYKIRYFNLPARLNIKYSVFLKEDGSIGTNVLRMSDAASTTICFNIPDYEKCVTYGSDGPVELEILTQAQFDKAELLVSQSITGK